MAWRVLHTRAFDRGVVLSVVFNNEVQRECVLGKDHFWKHVELVYTLATGFPRKFTGLPPNLPKFGSVRRMGYHFVTKELPPRQCPWIYDHSFPGKRDVLRKSEFKLLSLGPLRSKNRCTERYKDWSLDTSLQAGCHQQCSKVTRRHLRSTRHLAELYCSLMRLRLQ